MKSQRIFGTVRVLALLVASAKAAGAGTPFHAIARSVIPPTWDVVADDFESGTLEAWNKVSEQHLSLVPAGGRSGSTGLSVAAGQSTRYIYQTDVAKAEEGYLTFWFNPNGVVIPDPFTWWPPGNSISVASVVGPSWWPPLASLYVRKPTGQGYRAYLAWPTGESSRHYDYEEGEFDLIDGWQKITLGYRLNEWVAVWHNDVLVRQTTEITSTEPYGEIIMVGKTNSNSDITPTGTMRFDDVVFHVPRVDDLWADAENGSDDNDGLSSGTAFKTIQKAADLAGPGTTVHILPGVYRETVWPAMNGSGVEPSRYVAENGPGTAVIRGSEPSSVLTWTLLTSDPIGLPTGVYSNVYWADLSAWNLDGPPRFIVELEPPLSSPPQAGGTEGGQEVLARLPLAREPDWQVATEWKHHEFWWAADGGSSVAGCDPASDADPNCDYASRSTTQLTDQTNDSEPVGAEAGNLTTLGNLTGGTLIAIDTLQGHYVYRRTITAHDVGAGRVTVDRICEHDGGTGNPGLGWGSKYYVENRPYLLDTPGEWWYDATTKRLYLWPPTPANPATLNIEISRRDNGFSLRNRSYIILDGLTVEFLDGSAIYLANWETHKAYGDVVRNVTLRYANWGVYIEQSVRADAPVGNVIDGFTLEDSEIAHMDTLAIRLIDWWENGAAADSFTHSGVLNTVIQGNEMHHLGFRTDGDNAVGASFGFANKLRIEDNHVHHVAHNGFQISRSVIQSSKTYGFSPSEIKTGEILIKDNIFEKACQLTTDCAGFKFWGSPPDNHVFREVLVTGNVFRDTFGWTYVSEKRRRWTGGTDSVVRGLGGFGLYVDHASGIHAYRNVAYNNAYTGYMFSGVWRDGQMIYANNVAANSLYGFTLGSGYDTHGSVDTQVVNNIVVSNEAFGMSVSYATGRYQNMTIDYNLYYNNGWRPYPGGMWHAGPMVVREDGSWDPYQTLAEVQANTPWEDHGVAGDPALWAYNAADHDLFDYSWPDFHLTAASSNAIDGGTTQLPASLAALLALLDVEDNHWGMAFDIGRYEAGFAVVPAPAAQAIDPGGTARYALSLYPPDLPHTVTLTLSSPPAGLSYALSSNVVTPNTGVTLTVSHDGSPAGRDAWHMVSVTGDGGGFTQTASARLLVGGAHVYLPLVSRH